MASKKKPSAPLTFDLGIGLLRKIEDYQRKAGIASKSEVIRDAIDTFDYDGFTPEAEPHRQISVRLPTKQKRDLARIAKRKKVSLGELLRVALRALPDDPPETEKAAKAEAKPKKTAASSKVAPKRTTVKKAGAKSASAGKGRVSRAAAKAAPTRSATKRTASSGSTTKKAPARKSAARKASSPRATSRKPAKKN